MINDLLTLVKIIPSSLTQGVVWAVMGLGLYFTFRLLNFSDLTAEGSFPLGGIIAATLITLPQQMTNAGSWVEVVANPFVATLIAMVGGALAGLVAGLVHTKMKIPPLLTGILMQTGLYSINLHVSDGRSNIPLLGQETIYSKIEGMTLGAKVVNKNTAITIVALIILCVLIGIITYYLHTESGLAFRATGDNSEMSEANGIDTNRMKILGYMIGNSIIALAGAMVAQKDSFADIQMGIGTIVIGLSSIIIAEAIFPNKSIGVRLTTIVAGSFIYRLIIDTILNQPWIPIRSTDLRLFSAILLALVLFLPEIQKSSASKKAKKGAN